VDATDSLKRQPKPVCKEGKIGPAKREIALTPARVPARRPVSEKVEALRPVQDSSMTETQNRLTPR
jgi:hypothetical protein